MRTMVYATNVDAFTSYGMSGAACGARLRASAAGGCGPHGSKSRTTATANRSPGPAAIVPPRQPYFVILNEVDRRTQRVQRPLADYAEQGGERQTKCSQESFSLANQRPRTDYAEQGGERQTKCSQESVYAYFYTDSSSIFRSPQNDNTAFALVGNSFLVPPGPAAGVAPMGASRPRAQGLPYQKENRACGTCLP